jgi:copper chaperone
MKKAKHYSSWKELVAYSSDGPKHTELIKTEGYNAVVVGLETGQKISPHPAPTASYHFLEGSGWMIVDGERIAVEQGSTVVVPAGIPRGMEADTRLAVLASHAVPNMTHAAPMSFKRMGLMGLAGMAVMVSLMIVIGLVMGSQNPMVALMFSSGGPLGFGLWGLLIVPLVVMPLMMGTMFLLYRRMARRGMPGGGMAGMAGHDPSLHAHMNMSAGNSHTFKVPAVTCDHCKMTIETGLKEITGVVSVKVDVKAKKAVINFGPPATLAAIEAKLAEIGYPAESA